MTVQFHLIQICMIYVLPVILCKSLKDSLAQASRSPSLSKSDKMAQLLGVVLQAKAGTLVKCMLIESEEVPRFFVSQSLIFPVLFACSSFFPLKYKAFCE